MAQFSRDLSYFKLLKKSAGEELMWMHLVNRDVVIYRRRGELL